MTYITEEKKMHPSYAGGFRISLFILERKNQIAPPTMLTTRRMPLRLILRSNWMELLGAIAYATLIYFADRQFDRWLPEIPPTIVGLLGTSIALFLGFRINSSYDRWWEARKIWGQIVNDSRTLVRQTFAFTAEPHREAEHRDAIQRMRNGIGRRQVAWCYALSRSLRGQDPLPDLSPFLSERALESLCGKVNVPNVLLQHHSREAARLLSRGYIDGWQHQSLDRTIASLCDCMGKCERIKNTIFPTQYTLFLHIFILFFILLVPHTLTDLIGAYTIPFTGLLTFLFLMIESLEVLLQNPFENLPNDTPMTALSRTIEIDIRQQMGEQELPPKLEPVKGVLM